MHYPISGDIAWQRSKSCGGDNCVQVATFGEGIILGDSKDPQGPFLRYSVSEWEDFLAGVKNGDFDHLA